MLFSEKGHRTFWYKLTDLQTFQRNLLLPASTQKCTVTLTPCRRKGGRIFEFVPVKFQFFIPCPRNDRFLSGQIAQFCPQHQSILPVCYPHSCAAAFVGRYSASLPLSLILEEERDGLSPRFLFTRCVQILVRNIFHLYNVFQRNTLATRAKTRLLTYFLIYFLTSLLTYFLPYFLTSFLPYLLTYLLTYFLPYLLTSLLTYFLIYLLTYFLTSFLT